MPIENMLRKLPGLHLYLLDVKIIGRVLSNLKKKWEQHAYSGKMQALLYRSL